MLGLIGSASHGLIVASLRPPSAPLQVRMLLDKFSEGSDQWWTSQTDKYTAGVAAGGYNVCEDAPMHTHVKPGSLISLRFLSLVAFFCQLGKYTRFSLSKQLALNSEFEECVVDAENLSEINACQDPRVEPKVASPNIFNSITSLLNKLAPKPAIDYDKDECIVFSENFEELQAC